MKKTIIRLAVNEPYKLMFTNYCNICADGIEQSSMGTILYDWKRDHDHKNKAVFKLTFTSFGKIVNFFLQLGRIIKIDDQLNNFEFLEK